MISVDRKNVKKLFLLSLSLTFFFASQSHAEDELFKTLDNINSTEGPLFDYTPTEGLFTMKGPPLSDGNLISISKALQDVI